MSQELPLGVPLILTHTSCDGELYPGRRQIPGAEGPGSPTPTVSTPSYSTADIKGVTLFD